MEYEELKRLIKEDNVDELAKIINNNSNQKNNFNILHEDDEPLLFVAVKKQSEKVLEYLLSQDFIDKTVLCSLGENIYYVILSMRGAEHIFSLIQNNVPHNLLLNNTFFGISAFQIACVFNNLFIVKSVYNILKSLKTDLKIISYSMKYARINTDIEVIKFILSIDEIKFKDEFFFTAIQSSKFDIVVYLLNFYIRQSIPSHLHHLFNIFHFVNHPLNHNNNNNNNNTVKNENGKYNLIINNNNFNNNTENNNDIVYDNNNNNNNNNNDNNNTENNNNIVYDNNNSKMKKIKRGDYYGNDNNDYNKYLIEVEKNYRKLIEMKRLGNRIWHGVCKNQNLDVVQLIFSLKDIQPEILNENGENVFLIACERNSNLKIIKFIHKIFPSFIHSQKKNIINVVQNNGGFINSIYLVAYNRHLNCSDKLKIFHYLYLNGINIHHLTFSEHDSCYTSLYSLLIYNKRKYSFSADLINYLKVISKDFDYLKNEHDLEGYKKPSFWKEIQNNNNNNNHHNNFDELSMRVNEWKNRFEEHVLRHLSKMIQEHMLDPQ